MSVDTVSKLTETHEPGKNGTIVSSSNFSGNTPENFSGLN
jgi:hypothetical protein